MAAIIHAQTRTTIKHSTNRKLREGGFVPAVVYGKEQSSKPVAIQSTELLKTVKEIGRNGLFTLVVNDENHSVMLHELQRDPIRGELIHADFHIVDLNTEVEVDVNVHLVGNAQGVKDGGVLQQATHQLTIRSLPTSVPKAVDIDVTTLEVGGTLTVADIQTNQNYEIINDPTEVICSILAPRQEEEIHSGEQQEPGRPTNEEGRETTPE